MKSKMFKAYNSYLEIGYLSNERINISKSTVIKNNF